MYEEETQTSYRFAARPDSGRLSISISITGFTDLHPNHRHGGDGQRSAKKNWRTSFSHLLISGALAATKSTKSRVEFQHHSVTKK